MTWTVLDAGPEQSDGLFLFRFVLIRAVSFFEFRTKRIQSGLTTIVDFIRLPLITDYPLHLSYILLFVPNFICCKLRPPPLLASR